MFLKIPGKFNKLAAFALIAAQYCIGEVKIC